MPTVTTGDSGLSSRPSKDEIRLPADGFVIGEPVSVVAIAYEGNTRRGLTARCRREDGSEHEVAASEVTFTVGSKSADYIAAYRKWLGIEPYPDGCSTPWLGKKQHKATADDLDLSKSVELVVLSVKARTARCRLLDSHRVITLRAGDLWKAVPGEIVTVKPGKQCRFGSTHRTTRDRAL